MLCALFNIFDLHTCGKSLFIFKLSVKLYVEKHFFFQILIKIHMNFYNLISTKLFKFDINYVMYAILKLKTEKETVFK